MRLANKMKMLTAMTAAALLALSGCGSSGGASGGSSNSVASSGDGMVIGALLPLTGTLAYLAPPEVAAIKLAISDINKAGGVLGKDVTEVEADTSDGEHADQNTSAAQSVLSKHPSVVIGPAASGVVKNVYKSIVAEKIPVISMASTSMTLSGMDPYFFRTVAPDAVQGAVMGDLIAQDGVKKLAIACFNDEYGTGMRDIILQKLKDAGVDVVYGEKDAFDPAETNYSSIATAIKNSGADATLIISYDQATPLIKALASAGVDTHKLYLVDGNTVDYSKTYDAGLLKGSKGTIPGTHVDDKFKSDLKGTGTDISDTTYAAETYDAVILAALAAAPAARRSRRTSPRSPAPTAARSARASRPARRSSKTRRRSSTSARPASGPSTRTTTRARRTSASSSTTATTSTSSRTCRAATCRPSDLPSLSSIRRAAHKAALRCFCGSGADLSDGWWRARAASPG